MEQTIMDEQDAEYLSLAEASARLDIPVATLSFRLRTGEIAGHKVRGAHGREWRIPVAALDSLGRDPRSGVIRRSESDVELRAQVNRLRADLMAERRRAEQAEHRLARAVEEAARLRAQLENRHLRF